MYRQLKVVLTATLTVLSSLATAGTITAKITIHPAELQFRRAAGYDVVELERGITLARPGEPALPELPVTCLLPAGARLTGVSITPLVWTRLPGSYRICPAQLPRPISAPTPAFVEPDPTAYSATVWPAALHRPPNQGNAGGYTVAGVLVAPLRYQPTTGILELCSQMVVDFNYEPGPVTARTTQQAALIGQGLKSLVVNPADIARFAPATAITDAPEVNCVVITAARFASALEPHRIHRTRRGIPTEIRSVEWIERNYPGADLQERIRNFIRDWHEHRGLVYVVLAGDNSVIPCRRIHVSVGSEQGEIPTDLYYADLDWSWDSNHNGRYGEMGDSVDLYSDVLLGRVSIDRLDEIETFLNKVSGYENDPDSIFIQRALLPSGWLWRSLNYHGRFLNDTIAGFTPTGWTDVALVNPPGAQVVAESLDNGFALFDPAGHGNEQGVYDEDGTPIYTASQARNQRNHRRYSIMTSLACTPGNFEYEDCLAELAHNRPDGGCIAVMMNSRYGWGTPPYFGPSEKLCARFYDYLLARRTTLLGDCHSRSREEYAAAARYDNLWRWCLTEFNLFGDPAIDIWTSPPRLPALACPDSIATGSRLLEVTATASGQPLRGALVCAWKTDETYVRAQTDSTGRAVLAIRPATAGPLSITVTAHDHRPVYRTITVQIGEPLPHIVLSRVAIDDAGQRNPNSILEPGETAALWLTLVNSGNAAATDCRLSFRPITTGIRLSDTTAAIGTVAAGESSSVRIAEVTALSGILPGSTAEFELIIQARDGRWETGFELPIGWPGRTTAELDTGDVALTLTARGTLGWDRESERPGRGFRYPKSDTSTLRTASFVFAAGPERVIDRFYGRRRNPDTDWQLVESLFVRQPAWGGDIRYSATFSDNGHPTPVGITVNQHALAAAAADARNWVVLIYDIFNSAAESITGYGGIMADFDVVATDRLHDIAGTLPELQAAWMRNIQSPNRWVGIKLLAADGTASTVCVDHARYVNPDSALSEDMKYRLLTGALGSAAADRPYDWSVVVSAGPITLAPGGRRRVAFALLGAADSLQLRDACNRAQNWYDANVGLEETRQAQPQPTEAVLWPNPFRRVLAIRLPAGTGRPLTVQVFDATGRLIAEPVRSGAPASEVVYWQPDRLPAGTYFVRLAGPNWTKLLTARLTR